MQNHSEGESLVANFSDREKIHFNIKMPEYEISYSIPRLRDNPPSEVEVFAPQFLLNNPITDPEHSENVQHYLQQRLGKDEDREELKTLNISVRKDLLLTKIFQSKVNKKRAYEEIDSVDETDKNILEDVVKTRKTIEANYEQHVNRNQLTGKNVNYCQRKSKNTDGDYLEPECNFSKIKTPETKILFHVDSAIMKKIHVDCMMTMTQDLHGN